MSVNLYFGKTRGGKSFKCNKVIKSYSKKIIFDPTPKKEKKNYNADFETSDYSAKNMVKLIKKFSGKKKFSIIFRPSEAFDLYEQGERIAFFAMQLGKGFKGLKNEYDEIAVVFDEFDKYATKKIDSNMGKLAGMGRHFHCHLHCISQVPSAMPKNIRDNVYNIYAFALGHNEYYRRIFGKVGEEFLASSDFPKYHHLHWNDENGISFVNPKDKVIKNDKIKRN